MLGTRAAAGSFVVILSLLTWSGARQANAAVNAWSRIGPPGGAQVFALAGAPSDPQRLYAGLQYGGVFASADGGSTWHEANGDLRWGSVRALAVDPSSAERLLAVSANAEVRRSVDGGQNWDQVTPDLWPSAYYLSDLAFAPQEPDIAYLSNTNQLYRSEDGGRTWAAVSTGLTPDPVIVRVAPHPTTPREVWLATVGMGVLRSTDGGHSFEPRNAGFEWLSTLEIAFDPTSPARLYARAGDGLYRSSNEGESWDRVFEANDIQALEVDSIGGLWVVRAGIYLWRSLDLGTSWRKLETAPPTSEVAAIAGKVWAWYGPREGLRRSEDGGAHWIESSERLDAATIGQLSALRGEATRIVSADLPTSNSDAGICETSDSGATWRHWTYAGRGIEYIFAEGIEVDESDPLRWVFLGLSSLSNGYNPWHSDDGGVSWTRYSTTGSWGCLRTLQVVLDSVERDWILKSGTVAQLYCATLPDRCYLERSVDGGGTWTCLTEPAGAAPIGLGRIAAAPGRRGLLLAVNFDALRRSPDFGDSWSLVASPPAGDQFLSGEPVWSDSDHVSVPTFGGKLLRSTDGGESWTVQDLPLSGIFFRLVADPLRPDTLYLVTSDAVYVTDDGGATYEQLFAGLPQVDLAALAVDPVTPDRIYVGTFGAGILEYERRVPRPCVAGDEVHCLRDGRFEVRALWQDFEGHRGRARTLPLTDESGAFWFFDAANYELAVKVLDGRPLTDTFWTFFASLSNVEYRLLVSDSETGASRGYFNPAGRHASVGDVNSLPVDGAITGASVAPASEARSEAVLVADCAPGPGTLCLRDGRFELEAAWADFEGGSGTGVAVPLSSDTGAFWFFDDANVELLVKVLDGTGLNDRYWVFFGALSNVEFELTVRDLATGAERVYRNPAGRYASVGDVDAFEP